MGDSLMVWDWYNLLHFYNFIIILVSVRIMSTDENLLTAAPIAFILILPVFFYYCLRTLLMKQDCTAATLGLDPRIPEYLIKQYVDKTKQVRKRCSKPPKRSPELKPKLKHFQSTKKSPLLSSLCIYSLKI